MFIFNPIQSSSSLIKHYLKRRSSVHFIYTTSNITDESIQNNISLSTNKFGPFDYIHVYNMNKDASSKWEKKT